MPRLTPRFLLALSVLALLVPGQAPQVRFADICPPDAEVFVEFTGLDKASHLAKDLGLVQIWNMPEIQAMPPIARFVKEFLASSAATSERDQRVWATVKPFAGCPISFAAGDTTMIWGPLSSPVPIPMPALLAAVDLSGHVEAAKAHFDEMLGHLANEGNVTISRAVAGNLELTNFAVRIPFGPSFTIHTTFLGNLFIAGVGEDYFRRCLDVATQGPAHALASHPPFSRGRKKFQGDGLVEVYLNLGSIFGRVSRLIPAELMRQFHNLGLDAIGTVHLRTGIFQKDGADLLYVDAAAPRRGLLAPGGGKPLNPNTVNGFPDTAVLAFATRMPLHDIVAKIHAAAAAILPEHVRAKMDEGLGAMKDMTGVDLMTDVLQTFGDEFAFYAEISKLAKVPGLVLSFGINDPDKAAMLVEKIRQAASLEFKAEDHRGTTVHVLENDLGIDGPIKPRISYALLKDRLIIGLLPMDVKSAIERFTNGATKKLVESKGFKKATEGLPLDGAALVSFVDLPRVASFAYSAEWIAEKFGQSMPWGKNPLPAEDQVLAALKGLVTIANSDQDGIVFHARGFNVGVMVSVAARILMETPGAPHRAIGPFFSRMFRVDRVRTASSGVSVAPVSRSERAVNPLAAGDPKEAEVRKQIAEIDAQVTGVSDPPADLFFRRGNLRHQVRDFSGAVGDLKKARELGIGVKSTAAYNIACCLSLSGKTTDAIEWLKVALAEGFAGENYLETDSDLANLRGLPEFKALLEGREPR